MTGTVPERKPRVLAIADRPGWAIDHKTRALVRILADRFEIIVRYQHEVAEVDLVQADLILLYYWLQLRKLNLPVSVFERHSDRLMMGICSQFELTGELREPGLDALRRLPRAVFANNRRLERDFGPLIGHPVYYTPNGVNTELFRPLASPRNRQPGTIVVGWAGSLTNQGLDHRGFTDIIEPAVARVSGASLRTAIREQQWRSHQEMPAFYRELDVYVCASRSEGTPNPCLEAAACGVPLVTTRVGNMPELVSDGVNGLFIERTVDSLAQQLLRLRDNLELGTRLRARLLETISDWDWQIQAKRYADMFDELLK